MKVVPTVFAKNKKEFSERFRKLSTVSNELQIDFMDGKFVNAKSVKISNIPSLRKFGGKFEAHLMVGGPEKWIIKLKRKGFYKILFHYTSLWSLGELETVVKKIRESRMEAWIVFNPDIEIKEILSVLGLVGKHLDGVMFMGVYPGEEGQKFRRIVYRKIKRFRRKYPRIKIQVDGGINLRTAKKLGKLGVDIINSGSFIFEAEDPKKALKLLRKA